MLPNIPSAALRVNAMVSRLFMGRIPLIPSLEIPCTSDQAVHARGIGSPWGRSPDCCAAAMQSSSTLNAFSPRGLCFFDRGRLAIGKSNITSRWCGQRKAKSTYPQPHSTNLSWVDSEADIHFSIVAVRRSNPSAATATRSSSLLAKWRYGALWETPARRATSRSVKARGPTSPIRVTAASRRVLRRLAWW